MQFLAQEKILLFALYSFQELYIYIMKRQEGGPVKDDSGKFWQKNENNKGIIFKYYYGELQ